MAKALERLEAAEAAAADKLGYIRKTHTHTELQLLIQSWLAVWPGNLTLFFCLFVCFTSQPTLVSLGGA